MSMLLNPYRFAAAGATPFTLTMATTGAAETVTLPITGITGGGSLDVDWGDGNQTTETTDNPAHEYASADSYDIELVGDGVLAFNDVGDKLKLTAVVWGAFELGQGAFRGCSNMTSATGDGSSITFGSLCHSVFRSCTGLTSLDLSSFDTSSLDTMESWFYNCSSLTSLDVSGFDTSLVTSMNNMFRNCSSLTADPGIVNFDITAMNNAISMCNSANSMLSTAEYDAILIAWEAQTEKINVNAHFGDATYTSGGAAATARAALVSSGWTITDGGAV